MMRTRLGSLTRGSREILSQHDAVAIVAVPQRLRCLLAASANWALLSSRGL